MYGEAFNSSSKRVWRQFLDHNVDAVVASDYTNSVLFVGTLSGGAAMSSTASLWAYYASPEDTPYPWVQIGLYTFLVSVLLLAGVVRKLCL